MQVQVRDLTGATGESLELNDAVFGVEMNPAVVHQALVRQRANRRQGTHDTKDRSEVAGSGRKPWPQKHTGRARAGDKRSPLWRHGGTTFGPTPRDYSQDMPKKMRRLAIRCMLSAKQRDGDLIIVRDLNMPAAKTKEMAKLLETLGATGPTLVVTDQPEDAVKRSTRNLQGARSLPASLINVGDLLRYRYLVMTVDAVRKAEELWADGRVDRKRVTARTSGGRG